MEELEVNAMRQILTIYALLVLAAFRTVYCWAFLIASFFEIHRAYNDIRGLMQTHAVNIGNIVSNTSITAYSIVWTIAWWMILRKKPTANRWAIAANIIFIFDYFPLLAFGNWRGFLAAERAWWLFILVGIFGIIIFSIPYHGWRVHSCRHSVAEY